MLELAHAPLLFWFFAGVFTLAAICSAIWPMLKQKPDEDEASSETVEATRQVLIDQLDEIKRDHGRGLLNDNEVDSARAEVARRLLTLEREGNKVASSDRRAVAVFYPWAAIILIPMTAVGLYGVSGAPNAPGLPVATRSAEQATGQQAATPPNIQAMVAQVEERLKTHPDDVRGWLAVAPVYVRQGNLDKAEDAFRKILALNPSEKSDLGNAQNGLGQVLAMKSQGGVSAEALALFQQAKVNLPEDPTAFFFEALGLSQKPDTRDQAISAWEAVIARFSDKNPSWMPIAEQTLASLKAPATNEGSTPDTELPGPSSEDIEAAQELSETDRNELIENMVAGLAERLEDNPDDIQGWQRLVRSYMVLGRKSDASQALEKARVAFADDEAAKSLFDKIAAQHGL